MGNLQVKKKIFVLSGVMFILLLTIAWFSYDRMSGMKGEFDSLYKDNLVTVQCLNDARNQARAMQADLLYLIIKSGSPEIQKNMVADIEDRKKKFDDDINIYKSVPMYGSENAVFSEMEKNLAEYSKGREPIITLAMEGKSQEALDAYQNVLPVIERFQTNLKELAKINIDAAAAASAEQKRTFRQSIYVFLCIVLAGLFFGLIVTLVIAKDIVASLKKVVSMIQRIAGGDFSEEIPEQIKKRKDEFGGLVRSVSEMQESMRTMLTSVSTEAEAINAVVEDVSKKAIELNEDMQSVSATTEELAASMEETAASSEEMLATAHTMENAVGEIAEKAQEGSGKASDISGKVQEILGNAKNNQAKTEAMIKTANIELSAALEKVRAIDEINILAESIRQITEQTNLLALNAAIEAARAGEAGKGFSVVADEIRKLAENSKEAVNKIQDTTVVIVDSVNDLSKSSKDIMEFVDHQVLSDYIQFVDVSESFSKDASFYMDFSLDLSATSEELLSSITELSRAVEGVANAAGEGAEGTSEIAEKATDASALSDEIQKLVDQAYTSTKSLEAEMDKFKI